MAARSLTTEEFDRLYSAFRYIKAEDDPIIQDHTDLSFVDTKVYRDAQVEGKCIIIGRKGSGKTGLLLGHRFHHKNKYFSTQTVSADDIPIYGLFNFYLDDINKLSSKSKPNTTHQDINEFLGPVRLCNFAWKNAIISTALYMASSAIIENEREIPDEDYNPENLAKIRKLNSNIKELIFQGEKDPVGALGQGAFWSLLVISFRNIQKIIEDTLEADAPDLSIVLAIITRKITDALYKSVVSSSHPDDDFKEQLESLSHEINRKNKFIFFGFDKLDDYYEEFNKNILSRDFNGQSKEKREFLESLLEGLILASRDIKRDRNFAWLHLLITIPTDKFLRLKMRERAQIEYSHIIPLTWSENELFQFANRRIAYALNIPERDTPSAWYSIFPETIRNGANLSTPEDSFLYVARHTQMRPRDIQFYIVQILEDMREAYATGEANTYRANEDIFHRAVAERSKGIITQEFIPEFDGEYPNVHRALNQLEAKSIYTVMEYTDFCDVISGISLRDDINKPDLVAAHLFQMGVIGIRKTIPSSIGTRGSIIQDRSRVEYLFCYNSDDFDPFAPESEVVFHPMFFDRIKTEHRENYIINELKWNMFTPK